MHRMWQPLSKQRNHLIWVELQGEGSLSLVFHLFLFSFHNYFFYVLGVICTASLYVQADVGDVVDCNQAEAGCALL